MVIKNCNEQTVYESLWVRDSIVKKYNITEELFLFSCQAKLKLLGYGEWVEECDKITFQYLGYDCMIHRVLLNFDSNKNIHSGGQLAGYVKIPKRHVLHAAQDIHSITCHGGLTYNNKNPNVMKSIGHWIGFDCAHITDIIPTNHGLEDTLTCVIPHVRTYKNIDFCIGECLSMVDQLIEIQE